MKIGILSRNRWLYSTKRLLRMARERGHEVHVIDTLTVAVELGLQKVEGAGTKVVLRGPLGLPRASRVPAVDAVIPRIGASVTFYGLAVVRQFETQGVLTTAGAAGIACSRDKLHSLQRMSRAGLPIPRSTVIAEPRALFAAVQAVGGLPVVIKLIRGTQGKGVVLAKNMATVAGVLEKVRAANRQALVQEYVADARGRDLRVIVVGDQCVAAMERRAAEGDFRANLHQGGSAVAYYPDKKTEELAVAAAQAHQLPVAGVDLIQSDRGPLLLEVNSSPGLEGIEGITGINIAEEIIRYLERSAAKKHQRR